MRGKLETPIAGLKGLRELHWNSPKQKSHLREKKKGSLVLAMMKEYIFQSLFMRLSPEDTITHRSH